ncbi:MAG: Mu transposase C-terminal domain-containing protein [Planctomycetes bacterium]|nr:Mu transposase C-terminal domain-containing protein [Planctomycetota bacterium]
MSGFVGIAQAASLMGITQRHVRRMCMDGKLAGTTKEGSRWRIPTCADPKLSGFKGPEDLINSQELIDIPAGKRDTALRRLGLIQGFEKYSAAHVRSGGGRTEALELFAAGNNVSKRSMERWIFRYRNEGLLGLVDTRGGGKFISQMISPDAFDYFKSIYLTQQQRSLKACWQDICYINKTEDRRWKVPSLDCMYKYVKQSIPFYVQVLHREGMAAYEAKCAPYIEKDPESVLPNQIWVGDHHQCNCWIRHQGKWVRPWLTAWLDMSSRTLVGWNVNCAPNQTTIMLAMKKGIEKYGPPDSVKIDNGKDYDSEMWTGTTKTRRRMVKKGYIDEQMVAGIYAMMNVGVSFSIPYHPQSKPIERWFDTFDRQLIKTIDTYCGKDSARKPEHLGDLLKSQKAIRNGLTLESFGNLVDGYVTKVYNHAAHSGEGMSSRSPAEVMVTRQSHRVLADGVLDLLMRVWSGELKIGKNGVRFKRLRYGQFNLELLARQGRKVRVAYDPEDLRSVHVYEAATLKLITIAEQNTLIRYGDKVSEEALRDAMRQKATVLKVAKSYRDSSLTRNMDLPTLAIEAMAASSREAPEDDMVKAIRPVRTPLDGQVREHKRRQKQRAVKIAVGAETIKSVVDLDIDLSQIQSGKRSTNVKLFDL